MKGAVLCALLCVAALATAQRYDPDELEDSGEEWVPRVRREAPEFEEEDSAAPEEYQERTRREAYDDSPRSCCREDDARPRRDTRGSEYREMEYDARPRRDTRGSEYQEVDYEPRKRREVRHYEVYEETGDEPQGTAPLFGPAVEEMVAAGTEHRARSLRPEAAWREEPGAPAPERYLAPADQEPEGTFHVPKHAGGHKQAAGGGHLHRGHHYAEDDAKTVKGYKSSEHSDKGASGHSGKELHAKEYEEAAGKKKKHHDAAGHQGHHEEEAHGQRGAKFDEKKGHKKGHKTKGYHNKYHKDEFHKEHKFYDDYHKGGSHHRYGKFHAKHASNEGGRKKAHHVDATHDAMHKGTKGFSNKGHLDSDHRGHNSKQGHEAHHQHQQAYGKKGGSQGGSNYGYHKP